MDLKLNLAFRPIVFNRPLYQQPLLDHDAAVRRMIDAVSDHLRTHPGLQSNTIIEQTCYLEVWAHTSVAPTHHAVGRIPVTRLLRSAGISFTSTGRVSGIPRPVFQEQADLLAALGT